MNFRPLRNTFAAETFYLPARVNIGAVVFQKEAVIIDSGLEAQAGKRVCRLAREAGWQIVALINTHTHADHIGGNQAIVDQFAAKVFTPDLEQDFARHTLYEPAFLIGGAAPWQDVTNKFLVAPPTPVTAGLKAGSLSWPGREKGPNLQILSLPGHSPDQIGVGCGDVLFCGDAFLGPDLLAAHGIPFNIDVERFLNTLDQILLTTYSTVLPSHGEPLERSELPSVLQVNATKIRELIENVYELLEEPLELETVVAHLCEQEGKTIASIGSFFLYRTAILAYLSYLHGQGRVETKMVNCRLYWSQVGHR
ncbi:MBL fold metallo-hydrolase [Heliobacillus mobilis]|uniref:MBL fold metallo-hydrolase n=1 Tax=Heliobacterium mobile TaxID=28064 RepID=A0A6I3SG02_HELMO|nr:MBL fold metallo-hydrolase [Heliobacterium mobile]MTV47524.1 MBL fold metallo-hydrolase [Heliobacterium mobile]